jgi:hypothetical protein
MWVLYGQDFYFPASDYSVILMVGNKQQVIEYLERERFIRDGDYSSYPYNALHLELWLNGEKLYPTVISYIEEHDFLDFLIKYLKGLPNEQDV